MYFIESKKVREILLQRIDKLRLNYPEIADDLAKDLVILTRDEVYVVCDDSTKELNERIKQLKSER